MTRPLRLRRFELPFKAVLLQCLDADSNPLPGLTASGFISHEGGRLFLYTCWHVVTGYDPHHISVGYDLPKRMGLRIALQDVSLGSAGFTIGGLQQLDVSLYRDAAFPRKPLWFQNEQHAPHEDLNAIGLRVPFWHDAVKLPLPENIRVSSMQVVEDKDRLDTTTVVTPGDKVLIAGYPYGFSTFGASHPTPVILTRFIAGRFGDNNQQLLLESAGAPGMSGGPVFLEQDDNLTLLGLYTGLVFPDHQHHFREKSTALGICIDMSLSWTELPLVPYHGET